VPYFLTQKNETGSKWAKFWIYRSMSQLYYICPCVRVVNLTNPSGMITTRSLYCVCGMCFLSVLLSSCSKKTQTTALDSSAKPGATKIASDSLAIPIANSLILINPKAHDRYDATHSNEHVEFLFCRDVNPHVPPTRPTRPNKIFPLPYTIDTIDEDDRWYLGAFFNNSGTWCAFA